MRLLLLRAFHATLRGRDEHQRLGGVAIIIARRYLYMVFGEGGGSGQGSGSGTEGDGDDDILDLQAGHSTHVADTVYGRQLREGVHGNGAAPAAVPGRQLEVALVLGIQSPKGAVLGQATGAGQAGQATDQDGSGGEASADDERQQHPVPG